MSLVERVLEPQDPRLDVYRGLRAGDARVRRRGFIAEGLVVIEKALAARRYPIDSVLIAEARLERVLARLPPSLTATRVFSAPQAVMDEICGFPVHRGVLAFGRAETEPEPQAVLDGLPSASVVVCVIGVNDPENVGAIFRNAAALGADAVLVDGRTTDPLYRRTIRVSVGAALTMAWARWGEDVDPLAMLEANGFACLALTPSGEVSLKAVEREPRMALLLGAEGPGLAPSLLARARTVRIPMAAGFDSLNVGAASAVALHHLLS